MSEEDEEQLRRSGLLWNLIHDEVADAMRMEKQPEPENPMLGRLTAIKRTYKVFTGMKELGFEVVVPVLEEPKPIIEPQVSTSTTSGPTGISVTNIPKVIWQSTAGKLGSTIKSGLKKAFGLEEQQEKPEG